MRRYSPPRPTATILGLMALLTLAEWRPRAAGTIAGVVFEDFNGNGVRDTTTTIANEGAGTIATAFDRGVGGVVVTVYDGAGVAQGTATTAAANGSYSIAATGTGPYRVEFTGLPTGYRPSAFASGATGNGTTVQFVPDGNSANINLGILDAANFCQNNPTLITSCFVFGGEPPTGPYPTAAVVVDFPYSSGANSATATDYEAPTTHPLMVQEQAVGTVFGLGYRRQTNRIYAAAFMKKHSRYGPSGPGAIYLIDPSPGSGSPTLFADLDAIFGAGTTGGDAHAGNGGNYDTDNGDTAWNAVGKTSLGGLEVSPDGAFVFVVNLADRRVYRLPTTGPLTPATVTSVSIPLNAPGATGTGGADLRPFALQYHKGLLYVGIVNSAESAGTTEADLRAYIYTLDPVALTFSASPALQFALDYPRGAVQTFNPPGPAEWNRWSPVFANESPVTTATYPQPILSGLAVDVDGNLTIGLRDRAGDEFGFFTRDDPGDTTRLEGVAGGDTLLAAINTPGDLSSGWTLESNTVAGSFGPTAGAGNGQGPGNGEYYFQEDFTGTHEELSGGAVLHLPGFPDVMTSAFDPGLRVRTGGFLWMAQIDGTKTKGYDLYNTGFVAPPVPTFSKANGFGEVVAICQAAPIEIGNRIWNDLDGDGVQDPGEPGLDGVTVQLIAPGGAVLTTVVTANGGQYYFSSTTTAGLFATTSGYVLRIAPQVALGSLAPTAADADGSANGDSRDSDGVVIGANVEVPVTTGAAGDNNHTYDFGFTAPVLSLGNYVWFDTNNDGAVGGGELPIDGVDIVLYRDNGNGVFNATTDTLVATQTTAGGGLYLFAGLVPGSYFVQIPASEFGAGQTLNGYVNSGGQVAGDTNNVDHGAPAPVAGQGIVSDLVTLTVGGEPTSDGDADANSNLTIDFGFYRLSLGNLVFDDTDNSGTFNAGDVPRDGVVVELMDATGTTVLASTVTAGGGQYQFTGLTPGDYRVRVTPPPGLLSSTGGGSEPATDPDNDTDNDDNGTQTGSLILSAAVTLTPGAEPVVTSAIGATANPTVDVGLIAPPGLSLGNLVWRDDNNDGVVSPGEPGIDGVTVRLFDATGTVQLGTQVTAGGGFYLFTGLAAGNYIVEVVTPTGFTSSSGGGTEPAPDPDNDVNNDDNGTTAGAVVRSTPVTLALGSEPTNDGDSNANSNLSVDFGFVPQQGPGVEADVCLAQQVPATVAPGGQMTALYSTTNRGPGAATDVVIDGMLPSGVTVVSSSPSPGGACTVASGLLECRWPGSTPAGPAGARSVSVVFQVGSAVAPGTPLMLWFMTSASNSDPYPACNMVDGYVFVSGGSATPVDLRVDASAVSSWQTGATLPAAVGQPMTARFTVTNSGAASARGHYAVLLDEAGIVDVASATVSQGAAAAGSPTSGTWDTGPIAAGGTATLSLSLVPRLQTGTRIQLVRFDGAPADPNAVNDSAELVIDAVGTGGGRFVAAGDLDGVAGDEIIAGAGLGETPQVKVYSGAGAGLATFSAFDRAFRGGVRLASCDVDGNGVDELIAAQGPGGGRVRVLSLAGGTVTERVAFDAFEPAFAGGVNVACSDLDGDGRAEIVVGPEAGRAPDVKVFAVAGSTASVAAQFQAYEPTFLGGVRVGASRFTGSALVGPFSVVTTPGPGRAVDVRAFAIGGGGGVLVAAAPLVASTAGARVLLDDVTGDATPELVIAPEAGAPLLVQVFSLATGSVVLSAPPGAGGFGSVHVAAAAIGGGRELVLGSGAGQAPTVVTVALGAGGSVTPRLVFTSLETP